MICIIYTFYTQDIRERVNINKKIKHMENLHWELLRVD